MLVLLLSAASPSWSGAFELGRELMRAGKATEARPHLEQAVAETPDRVPARWELGWAYWNLGQYADAAAQWTTIRQLDPEFPEVPQWSRAAQYRASLAAAPRPSPVEVETTPTPGPGLTVAAVGDTMMGSDLRYGASGLPPDDGRGLFAAVRDRTRAAQVAFVNLEGALADGVPAIKCTDPTTSSSCYAFRTPTRYTAALVDAGFDLASIANNHAFDLGLAGAVATMQALDDVNIAHAGMYGDVAHLEVDGLRVAMVGTHFGPCCLNVNDIDSVVKAIVALDAEADLVVLSFHAGAEGPGARHVPGEVERAFGERRGDVKALARAAVDHGADLVIGHGPHVLRAMEVYRGRLIAYSLGNFSGYRQFGVTGDSTSVSTLLEAEIARNGVVRTASVLPLFLDKASVPGLDPEKRALVAIRELSGADFPDTGVKVAEDGTLTWAKP